MSATEAQSAHREGLFATTHWTVIFAAAQTQSPEAQHALEDLCGNYRHPLYCFARRKGLSHEDAEDVTQQFFAERVVTRLLLQGAHPAGGRFRTWLLTSFQNFVLNAQSKRQAQKRGGGVCHVSMDAQADDSARLAEPACGPPPEQYYDRAWARTVLDHALEDLRIRYAAAGEAALFEEIRRYLPGPGEAPAYSELAPKLGISEAALKMRVSRLKKDLGQLIRGELRRTVATRSEVESELKYLVSALAGS